MTKKANSVLVSSLFIKKYNFSPSEIKQKSLEGGRTGSGIQNTVYVLYTFGQILDAHIEHFFNLLYIEGEDISHVWQG